MPPPGYPAILLADNWNAKKGKAAKILFPTKLGEELRTFHTAYTAVQWDLAYKLPTDATPIKQIDDQILQCKQVFKGELDHLKATGLIAKTHAIKIRGEWSKNPLVAQELKTYLDSIIKNFDPLLAKIEHDSGENFKAMVTLRMQLAAANPQEASDASKIEGTKQVVRDKNAPKSDVIKTKFKQPQPPKPQADEGNEEEEEENVPKSPPVPKRTGSNPPPPKPRESEADEREGEQGRGPKAPPRPTAGNNPQRPTNPPVPKPTAKTVPNSPPKPGANPKAKEKESNESEGEQIPKSPPVRPRPTGNNPPPPTAKGRGNQSRESESEG